MKINCQGNKCHIHSTIEVMMNSGGKYVLLSAQISLRRRNAAVGEMRVQVKLFCKYKIVMKQIITNNTRTSIKTHLLGLSLIAPKWNWSDRNWLCFCVSLSYPVVTKTKVEKWAASWTCQIWQRRRRSMCCRWCRETCSYERLKRNVLGKLSYLPSISGL